MSDDLKKKLIVLLDSITNDMAKNGDILSRETVRAADEVRLALSREGKNEKRMA